MFALSGVLFLGSTGPRRDTVSSGNSRVDAALIIAIPRTESAPVIDGIVDDEIWEHAAVLTGFTQSRPEPGIIPADSTIALIAYDRDKLYVAVIARGDPSRMRASIMPRDEAHIGTGDDGITLRLDTFNDSRRAYVIQVNPRGVQQDGTMEEGQWPNMDENFVWVAAGKVDSTGYVVEMAIPFTSLKFPSKPTFDIGFNLFRHYAAGAHEDSWAPQVRGHPCDICQQGVLTGIHDVSTRHTLDVRPYLMGAEARDRSIGTVTVPRDGQSWLAAAPGDWLRSESQRRAGADLRLALTPSYEVLATVHPDFSQIEASPEQIRVNRRFAIYDGEKRPFFTMGGDAFSTAAGGVGSLGSLFYSRDIVDPSVGARLSGKSGGLTVAGLYAHDQHPSYYHYEGYESSGVDASVGGAADVGVLRLRRDIRTDSYLGFTALRREHAGGANQVFGGDIRFRANRFTWIFDGVVSDDRLPVVRVPLDSTGGCDYGFSPSSGACQSDVYDGRGQTGGLFRTALDYTSAHLSAGISGAQVSPGFRDQLGSLGRVGIQTAGAGVTVRQYPHFAGLREIAEEVGGGATWGYHASLLDYSMGPRISFNWIQGSSFGVGSQFSRSTFLGRELETSNVSVKLALRLAKGLYIDQSVGFGDQVIYDFTNPRVGSGTNAGVTVWYRPVPSVLLNPSYTHATASEANGGPRVATADLLLLNAQYQYSPRLGFRLYTQFSDQSSTLITNPFDQRSAYLRSSFLVGYELVPTSFLYVGVNDERRRFDEPAVTTSGYSPTGLRFFLKVSYLLRV